jgi:hypothetical protein
MNTVLTVRLTEEQASLLFITVVTRAHDSQEDAKACMANARHADLSGDFSEAKRWLDAAHNYQAVSLKLFDLHAKLLSSYKYAET